MYGGDINVINISSANLRVSTSLVSPNISATNISTSNILSTYGKTNVLDVLLKGNFSTANSQANILLTNSIGGGRIDFNDENFAIYGRIGADGSVESQMRSFTNISFWTNGFLNSQTKQFVIHQTAGVLVTSPNGLSSNKINCTGRGNFGSGITTNGTDVFDYTQGFWTPSLQATSGLGSIVYTTQNGYFVRNGRVITCYFSLNVSYSMSSPATQINIVGLPYTPTLNGVGNCTINTSVNPLTTNTVYTLQASTSGYINIIGVTAPVPSICVYAVAFSSFNVEGNFTYIY